MLIVFGGANCEGVMGAETLRQFPWVDAAVSGEGDVDFPGASSTRHLAGEVHFGDARRADARPLVEAFAFSAVRECARLSRIMDALPYPDYREYFEQFERSRFGDDWQPGTFMETSRGCWWGERMHCTFCGLNGAHDDAIASKSAARALDEMTALAATHKDADIQVVDNILDLEYASRRCCRSSPRARSTSASSTRRRAISSATRSSCCGPPASGRSSPGIESFSDDILKLMRKGVTALHNIQVLKWCKEFGGDAVVEPDLGFPGESARGIRAHGAPRAPSRASAAAGELQRAPSGSVQSEFRATGALRVHRR